MVEDCGKLINPAVVDGQVRGGVAQGIGAVLLERSAYDDEAQFLSGTFMDYLLPTATEIPRIEIHHLETVPLDPDVNFRGVGEGGMIVSPPTLVQRHRGRAGAVRRPHHRAAPAAAADPGAPRQGVTRALGRHEGDEQRDAAAATTFERLVPGRGRAGESRDHLPAMRVETSRIRPWPGS